MIIAFQLTTLVHVLRPLDLAMTQQLFTGMCEYGLALVECCSEIARSVNSARNPTFDMM
jgi:hypothetical protein